MWGGVCFCGIFLNVTWLEFVMIFFCFLEFFFYFMLMLLHLELLCEEYHISNTGYQILDTTLGWVPSPPSFFFGFNDNHFIPGFKPQTFSLSF